MTSHFQFFHNSHFYVLFIFYKINAYNTNLGCTISPSELQEIKLVRVFQGLLYRNITIMVFYCCLKFSSND